MITRRAQASWQGSGSGTLSSASGVLDQTPYAFDSRFRQQGAPQTSPEELLAAAHAGCYAMSLGFALSRADRPATDIQVAATVSLEQVEGGFHIVGVHLEVSAQVPGSSEEDFAQMAAAASALCPLSLALHSVPVTLSAVLRD